MGRVDGFWAGAQDHGRRLDLQDLAERAGGWDDLRRAGEGGLVALGVPPVVARAWLRTPSRTSLGALLTLADPHYPDLLRKARPAPPVIAVEGDVEALHAPAVAVVGTRACTAYGVALAQHIGGSLAAGGVTVVSGLARGIDGHAHRAAVRVGRTVAVLGHGLEHTSPASHRHLRRSIVEAGGAIVSAWPDGFGPRPATFPVRNRWIAGLSEAVVVVEAPRRSGALYTAEAAAELGREVWAVPGPVGAPASRGCLDLVAAGAQVLVDADEFTELWTGRSRIRDEAWLERLFHGASLEEASRLSGRPVAELLAELAQLEVRGEVVRLPGQRYVRSGILR